MNDEFRDLDVNQQIGELMDRIGELREQCRYRSSSRISRELRRFAKAEKQIIPYLHANFYLMNDAQSLLDVETGIEAAVDSIAYLESEEKARKLQPELPEDHYYYTVNWMSTCAYDNLATHTAEKEGYNSDGVHDCINDGIQVCRRTGKLECITCFREYATDVYRAADDVDMALHYARMISGNPQPDPENDRRWVGAKDIADLLLLSGQLGAAREAAIEALKLAGTYHSVLSAQMESTSLLSTILDLEGRPEDLDSLVEECGVDPASFPEIEPDEYPVFELQKAMHQATSACCRGEYSAAIGHLVEWDRRLLVQKCLSHWFEVRLRLIAIHKLAGQDNKAEALIRQLMPKAQAARDWLTIRRLKLLIFSEVKPNPLATLSSFQTGVFAEEQPGAVAALDATEPSEPKHARAAQETGMRSDVKETPLKATLDQYVETLQEAGGEEEACRMVQRAILAYQASDVEHPEDAARLIHMAHVFSSLNENAAEVWEWAQPFLTKFPQDPAVLNVVADLGDTARETTDGDPDTIATVDQLERMLRESLDLDPGHAGNFARAGAFFLQHGEMGEAERCYARSFRLDRTRSDVAVRLADLYNESDRARDALAVLDLCLREGCQDPAVYWQAGQIAFEQEKYDWVLTYYNRLEEVWPDKPWVPFYLAWALMETGKHDEALRVLESESLRNTDCRYHVDALRACIFGAKGKNEAERFRKELQKVLDQRLSNVEALSQHDLTRLFHKLTAAVACLAPDDETRLAFEVLTLQTGLAAEMLFEPHRQQEPVEEGLSYFVVLIRQPLDENWPMHPGCLSGQEPWPAYVCPWGVLARDEEEAEQWVKKWQSQCYPLEMEVLDVQLQNEGYRDSPGIVWQGAHQPPFLPMDDEDFDDEFDDDLNDMR